MVILSAPKERTVVNMTRGGLTLLVPDYELHFQSATVEGEMVVATSTITTTTTQEVMEFLDENTGQMAPAMSVPSSVLSDMNATSADLGTFLSRPVKIGTFTWAESDAVGTIRNFKPWQLFFNDSRIKYKLNNYSFIACTLKIKVLINASPFYYGAMLMNYQPLPTLTPSTIVYDSGVKYFIPMSQRPHIWIHPQSNAAGTLELPYLNHRNWLRVQRASDFSEMGDLSFINFTTLQSANGVTGQGVTLQVYAWAENVSISGPSVGLSMQTRDEYSISTIASAVAALSASMTRIPIIGPYMTATQMGAKAVSAGAAAMGYTNVPVIEDVKPLRPVAFPSMASSEIGFPVEKLTLDPKSELSIDPRILGLSGVDELSIAYLVQRESYLTTLTMSTTHSPDDLLFQCRVNPVLFDSWSATAGNIVYYMAPMAWVSALFNAWRGDIIFRFRVVASPFHKGRVRVTFDPYGISGNNIAVDAVSSSVAYTKILDIGCDTDVEMRIPYSQALSWSRPGLTDTVPFTTSSTPSFSRVEGTDNGFLTVRVLTALTAPVASAPISVLVSVRGADNLEFANPQSFVSNTSGLGPRWSYLTPQSKEEYDMEGSEQMVMGSNSVPAPERFLVNYGEVIPTLRSLLRRSTLSCVKTVGIDPTSLINSYRYTFSRIPVMYGYDAAGDDFAKGIVTPANTYKFNWNTFHPLAYLAPAFVGMRGSVNWTFNVTDNAPAGSVTVQRNPTSTSTYGTILQAFPSGTDSQNSARFIQTIKDGSGGMCMTNQLTQAGMTVCVPNMSRYRFQSTNPAYSTAPSAVDDAVYDMVQLEVQYNGSVTGGPLNSKIWCYAGIGTDFNLHFFLNVPSLWFYGANPVSV